MRLTGLLLALLPLSTARADDVPHFARNKPRIEDKDEGNHFEALPLLGYDTNTGFGLGVGGFYTMNGSKRNALFTVTPYRHRIYVQTYFMTLGYQSHYVSYDGIYVADSPYRVRASAGFVRNNNANYFGIGEETMGPLTFRGRSYETYDEQTNAASQLANGVASPLYNHFTYNRPFANVSLERSFLGGLVRAQYGVIVQWFDVSRFDGAKIRVGDQDAVHGETKLGMDCAAGSVRGCNGGFDDALKLGIALDTRDFEPDPRSGSFIDATTEWSSKGFGSAFDYLRFTLAARNYWTPFPKLTELTLASRFVYSMQTDGAPFYSKSFLAMTETDQEGIGGMNTLRGYRQNRFVGNVASTANLELRWTFVRFKLFKQRFSLQAAPFVDVGRVWNKVDFSFTNWRASAGGALRVGWNRTTIIRFDAGASKEDFGFYIDFGMPF